MTGQLRRQRASINQQWDNVSCLLCEVSGGYVVTATHQQRDVKPMLAQCWASVEDGGQHWANIGFIFLLTATELTFYSSQTRNLFGFFATTYYPMSKNTSHPYIIFFQIQIKFKSNLFAQQLTLYRQNHIHLHVPKTYYIIILQIHGYIK